MEVTKQTNERVIFTLLNIVSESNNYEVVSIDEEIETPISDNSCTVKHQTDDIDKYAQLKQTILAWVALIGAILSMSAIGPMFKYSWEHGIPPMLISAWRSHSMTIFLLPPALIEHFFTEPEKRVKWLHIYSPELSYPLLVHVFISAFSWAVALNAWAISLEYISTVLASICYSVQPLVMSIYFYFIGTYLSKFEIFGVFLSLCGIAISSLDGIKGELRSHDASEMIGVLLCICGGMSDVVMVLVRKQQKKFVPLFQYTFCTNLIVGILSTIASLVFEGTLLYGVDDNCVFGFMSNKWRYVMLPFGLFVGLFCISGFNYSIQYMNPLVFTTTTLIDPLTTGFISYICGIETLPKLHVWIGGFTVILGVLFVTIGEHYRTSSEQGSLEGSDTLENVSSEGEERDLEMTTSIWNDSNSSNFDNGSDYTSNFHEVCTNHVVETDTRSTSSDR